MRMADIDDPPRDGVDGAGEVRAVRPGVDSDRGGVGAVTGDLMFPVICHGRHVVVGDTPGDAWGVCLMARPTSEGSAQPTESRAVQVREKAVPIILRLRERRNMSETQVVRISRIAAFIAAPLWAMQALIWIFAPKVQERTAP